MEGEEEGWRERSHDEGMRMQCHKSFTFPRPIHGGPHTIR